MNDLVLRYLILCIIYVILIFIILKVNYKEKYVTIYVTIINKTIDDNYILHMNGRKYKPFK